MVIRPLDDSYSPECILLKSKVVNWFGRDVREDRHDDYFSPYKIFVDHEVFTYGVFIDKELSGACTLILDKKNEIAYITDFIVDPQVKNFAIAYALINKMDDTLKSTDENFTIYAIEQSYNKLEPLLGVLKNLGYLVDFQQSLYQNVIDLKKDKFDCPQSTTLITRFARDLTTEERMDIISKLDSVLSLPRLTMPMLEGFLKVDPETFFVVEKNEDQKCLIGICFTDDKNRNFLVDGIKVSNHYLSYNTSDNDDDLQRLIEKAKETVNSLGKSDFLMFNTFEKSKLSELCDYVYQKRIMRAHLKDSQSGHPHKIPPGLNI